MWSACKGHQSAMACMVWEKQGSTVQCIKISLYLQIKVGFSSEKSKSLFYQYDFWQFNHGHHLRKKSLRHRKFFHLNSKEQRLKDAFYQLFFNLLSWFENDLQLATNAAEKNFILCTLQYSLILTRYIKMNSCIFCLLL